MKRYTDAEIDAVKMQLWNDECEIESKMKKIVDHIKTLSSYRYVHVSKSTHASDPSSKYLPYYYVEIPMSQYDFPTDWIKAMLATTGCTPPVSGIYINSKGFMWKGNVPTVGDVDVYVNLSSYDSHRGEG